MGIASFLAREVKQCEILKFTWKYKCRECTLESSQYVKRAELQNIDHSDLQLNHSSKS